MDKQEGRPGPAIDLARFMDAAANSSFQWRMIALMAVAVLLDGFDQQVLGFALPSLIREWGASKADFAPIVAAGLAGMTVGTAGAGLLGDRYGRRFAIIISLLIFGMFTVLAALARDVPQLLALRFLAGLGIGGALPNAAAFSAEFSSVRQRATVVTLTIVCIPLGGIVGGLIAAAVLPSLGWQALFLVAGLAPLVLAAILWRVLPETPRFLAARGDGNARVADLLRRMGHEVAPDMRFIAETPAAAPAAGLRGLFAGRMKVDTFALWALFFAALISVNLVFSWLPTMLSQVGFGVRGASYGLAAFNFGGVAGALAGAWLIARIGSRRAMIALALVGTTAGVLLSILVREPEWHGALMPLLAVAGFAINGVQTNCFAIASHIYDVRVRASGVGAALAIGRIGAIIASFAGAAALSHAGGLLYFPIISTMLALTIIPLTIIRSHIAPRERLDQARDSA